MDFSLIASSFGQVFSPLTLLYTLIGAAGGILIGSIPGLTATMGIALLVPFTYGLEFIPGVAMLLGIFCGGMYGGSIAAILIHTPGTPSAAATVLDGYPMGQKGQASRALTISLFSSFTGGIIGALIMTFLSPFISKMALKFGPAEFFALAVFGLSVIVSISGKDLVKGLITAVLGLLLATIGMDKTCAYLRFFKLRGLYDGIPFIPALIGLFAVSEVIANFEHRQGLHYPKSKKRRRKSGHQLSGFRCQKYHSKQKRCKNNPAPHFQGRSNRYIYRFNSWGWRRHCGFRFLQRGKTLFKTSRNVRQRRTGRNCGRRICKQRLLWRSHDSYAFSWRSR